MKTTIDIDDALYRRLEVEAARRGRSVRDLVAEGIRAVLHPPVPGEADKSGSPDSARWYGVLKAYGNKVRDHSLDSMRSSTLRGRKRSTLTP